LLRRYLLLTLGFVVAGVACWGCLVQAEDLFYDIRLAISPEWELNGLVTIHGTAAADLEELVLRVYQPEELSVSSIEVDGIAQNWTKDAQEPSVLRVHTPLTREQTYSLTAEFSGRVPLFHDQSGYGTFAASEHAVVLGAAYPMLAAWDDAWLTGPLLPWGDAVVADVADYRLTMEAPKGWEVVSGGYEIPLGNNVSLVEGQNLRELGIVLVKGYVVQSAEFKSVSIRSFSLPEHSAGSREALRITGEALQLYEALFGPYPYGTLDVVSVPLQWAAGVEYPGLILGGELYYARWEYEPLFFPMIFAHEVAHQWWYAQVGNHQVNEPWVDEALATYSSGLYFEAKGRLEEIVAYWQNSYQLGRRRNPHAMVDSPLWGFADGAGYGGIVYSGGALMLHDIRAHMGDELFLAALRSYLGAHRWGFAWGDDLLRAFAAHSPPSLDAVLARWLSR